MAMAMMIGTSGDDDGGEGACDGRDHLGSR